MQSCFAYQSCELGSSLKLCLAIPDSLFKVEFRLLNVDDVIVMVDAVKVQLAYLVFDEEVGVVLLFGLQKCLERLVEETFGQPLTADTIELTSLSQQRTLKSLVDFVQLRDYVGQSPVLRLCLAQQ